MNTLGWTEVAETASITPKQAALMFVGQKLYANDSEDLTIMLQLALVDGQTEVALRQVDPEER